MDEKLYKILKKVYYKKGYKLDKKGCKIEINTGDIYDRETGTFRYSTENLSEKELLYLQECGYAVNEIVYDTHDANLQKLKEIINHPNLSLHNLLSAYIAGYGSFLRGRQPIMSYLFARAVPVHSLYNNKWGAACEICSMKREFYLEKGKEIFRKYGGASWNEMVWEFYIDLEEFSQLQPAVPTKEDLQIFKAVIELIRNAPEEETPGQLEKRILKSKLIPKCEKYALRGQLITLAELGVLYNPYIKPLFDEFTDFDTLCAISRKVPGSSRSDIVLPFSGWRGEYGICEERFQELFGSFYAKKLNPIIR